MNIKGRNRFIVKESEVRNIVSKCVRRILRENQIIDNLCLQVERGRYGEFHLRDTETWLEWNASAWISINGKIDISLSDYKDSPEADALCDDEIFKEKCKTAILSEYPENIEGFDTFVDEIGDWNEALEIARGNLSFSCDTETGRNARISANMRDSGDFYSSNLGW